MICCIMLGGRLRAFTLSIFLTASAFAHRQRQPHIIVIMADDLGWNDVSFHGSNQIPTPNIDALAYNGVILNNHYVQPLCTPSRSAFMTGKYPIHTGTQHLVILHAEPWGLPLSEKLLPQFLKEAGYSTHAVGKWHLGFYQKEYTPTFRGFDTFYGYYNGFQDYYDHTTGDNVYKGYDMRRNMSVDWSARGKYSTDLFTKEAVDIIEQHTEGSLFLYLSHIAPHAGNADDPFQAPNEEVVKFSDIKDPKRRVYAAMVSKLDKSVGEVVQALSSKNMLKDSIIVFLSDNGGAAYGIHSNRGSNWPLRGMKETPWEGAVRGVAMVWSPLIQQNMQVSNQMMHIVDWLPSLCSAAGINFNSSVQIDGIDMWKHLVQGTSSPRTEFIVNYDEIDDYVALRRGDWKYVSGSPPLNSDGWYPIEETNWEYHPEEVLKSQVAAAITGYTTKLQIMNKSRTEEDTNFVWKSCPVCDLMLLDKSKILTLRKKATIVCNPVPHIINECRPCLFNIRDDPCEMIDLSQERPVVLQSLERSVQLAIQSASKPANVPSDPRANPANFGGVWTPWDENDPLQFEIRNERTIPLVFVVILLVSFTALLKFVNFHETNPSMDHVPVFPNSIKLKKCDS